MGVCCALGALGIWAYQLFVYLKYGAWVSISVLDALGLLGGRVSVWTAFPSDWLGLHAMLAWVPAALVLLCIGFFLMAWGVELAAQRA